MLFLYRPSQTRIPIYPFRAVTEQDVYNRRLQNSFESTRRVPPYVPNRSTEPPHHLAQLTDLHRAGVLSDAEFEAAKSRVTGPTKAPL